MFYGKYLTLCVANGETPSGAAKKMGLSKTTVNRWKNGGGVTDATLIIVANYFKVSVSYFNENQKEKPNTDNGAGLTAKQLEVIEYVKTLSPDELDRFTAMGKAAVERLP